MVEENGEARGLLEATKDLGFVVAAGEVVGTGGVGGGLS
jgi:hypothetical protein